MTAPRRLPPCRRISSFWIFGLAALLWSGAALAVQPATPEQEDEKPKEEAEEEAKLSFHAYLNQAYAVSDGNQIFGIPEQGTTDYRNVAVQMRYELTPKDIITVQVGQDRLGRSTVNDARDDLELEWAFYERLLTDATSIRIGKMALPFGIYNEIRDVGTLLPFYAPPFNFYLENFTSETLEGGMLSHGFARDSRWSLDVDLYYGGWERIEQDASSGLVAVARAENGIGTQVWLNTPVEGVRFGFSALRFEAEKRLNQARDTDTIVAYAASFDGTFDRFYLRAEGLWSEAPFRITPDFVLPSLVYSSFYGQFGFDLTPKWSVHLQADFSRIDFNSGFGSSELNDDYAVGLAYKFIYNVIAKAEVHRNEGFLAENEVLFEPAETQYALLSLAVSY